MPLIPLFDARAEYADHAAELDDAVRQVLASGRYILGPQVAAFETEAVRYLRAAHAVGVGSGTDALSIALRAVGLSPGDLVATTPMTFFATAGAICSVGCRPAFVDVDPSTLNMDPDRLHELLAGPDRIKAIIPVHLYGCAADLDPIRALAAQRGLPVIEDAAQAFGASYKDAAAGTLGTAGTFSFYPSKSLGAFGDAGLIVTGDEAVAERARRLRDHGAETKYDHVEVGYNSRLDEMQAALLRVKLRHLDERLSAKRAVAAAYDEALEGLPVTVVGGGDWSGHACHLYVVRVAERRDEILRALGRRGIECGVHYPVPVHLQPALAGLGYGEGDFPVAEAAAREILSLPMYPGLGARGAHAVAKALREVVADS
jgi:dTDP-4-amino-4,6-dideoxygalactose transaminase